MRKLLIVLLAALSLGAGSAFAQGNMMAGTQWIGASTGFPLGINLHYGMPDLLAQDLDLRINLSAVSFLFNGAFSVTGGADVLYHLNLETENDLPLDVYVGGGLDIGASIRGDDPATADVESSGVTLGLAGLVGAEYALSPELGLFGELRGGVGFDPIFQPALRIGINYYF
ncbi:MAG: hypothetical protein KC422_24465 [Trueperaceae bacterium]|nr:hypothetical protein [Trueperaceae bacterium]